MKPKMTPKQAAFVAEYLVDRNATQAAIRAGYSKKTAGQIGDENLKKPEIRAAIDAGLAKLSGKIEITAERVLRERARLAFFDPRKLFDGDGRPIPIHLLDDDTAAVINGVDVLQVGGEENGIAVVKKYRLAGKDASLAALEKHFGLNEKPIRFKLPEVSDLESCARAQAETLAAVASGELLPSEGETLSRLIENRRRAIETTELEQRIAALEEK